MTKNKKTKPRLNIPEKKEVKQRKSLIYFFLTIAAFILYGNTISHDYAYDDGIVITKNEYTLKGISGIPAIFMHDSFYGEPNLRDNNLVEGGRYRPLSLATFAVENQFFRKNPHISHFINILILLLTVILIYKLSRTYIFPGNTEKWYFSIPFIATLLFLFHPVHTESVANIKGRDDLLCLLFCIIATISSFKYFSSEKIIYLFAVFICLFTAMLSKENAVTFVAAIPLLIYFFDKNNSLKKYLLLAIPLILSAVAYLLIRAKAAPPMDSNIVPNLMNDSFIEATTAQKYATILLTFGLYLKLLFFPHPLTYDYYPYHIGLADWSSPAVIISLILWIGLIILAILYFWKKSIISFAILFFGITMSVVSNIFFPVGVFMSERFLYMSSLGFCLLMAYLFVEKLPGLTGRYFKYISMLFVVVLVLFSYKTISRNRVWASNQTLFAADVITSSGSAKSNYDYAISLSGQAEKTNDTGLKAQLYEKSLNHLRKALVIYPKYTAALVSYADISFNYRLNADTAIIYYEKARLIDSTIKTLNNTLGTLYGQYKGDYNRAIMFFMKDIKKNNASADTYKKLSMCYLFKKDTTNSLIYANKGLILEPDNPELLQLHNLGSKKK